jgi:hypothetical protein
VKGKGEKGRSLESREEQSSRNNFFFFSFLFSFTAIKERKAQTDEHRYKNVRSFRVALLLRKQMEKLRKTNN